MVVLVLSGVLNLVMFHCCSAGGRLHWAITSTSNLLQWWCGGQHFLCYIWDSRWWKSWVWSWVHGYSWKYHSQWTHCATILSNYYYGVHHWWWRYALSCVHSIVFVLLNIMINKWTYSLMLWKQPWKPDSCRYSHTQWGSIFIGAYLWNDLWNVLSK